MSQFFDVAHNGVRVPIEVGDDITLQCLGLADLGAADGDASDVVTAVAAALADPHGFLPLVDMLVPGDHLAIALEPGLPHCAAIVQGVLRAIELCELGKIEVVVADVVDAQSLERLRVGLPDNVQLTVHRRGDRASERYLAADESAEPIRVNLSLVDADFVLPIGVMRVTDPLVGGPCGDALFPAMVDEGQLKRLQRATLRAIEKREHYHNDLAADQAQQVRWALGVQLMLAVEVTARGDIGRVIASSPESLREAIRNHFAATHRGGEQAAADVVVACVDGGSSQQSIENLARAALVGRSYASPSGAVVLVTDLKSLGHPDGSEEALDATAPVDYLSDQHESQPLATMAMSQPAFARKLLRELINQIDSSRRYLLWSACEPEAAEAFGFGVITDAAALARLVNHHGNCCCIRAAQTAPDAGVLGPLAAP
jgi:hypothetical protein